MVGVTDLCLEHPYSSHWLANQTLPGGPHSSHWLANQPHVATGLLSLFLGLQSYSIMLSIFFMWFLKTDCGPSPSTSPT